MLRLVSGGACFALFLTMIACGGEDKSTPVPATNETNADGDRPSGSGACALLMQSEVDELFGTGIGAGVDETLEGGVRICSWPAGEDPALLLQIAPGSDAHAAVALGDGYEVVDIGEMSGPAAAAVENADGPGDVIVFALVSGDDTITISPVGLGVGRNSAEFARLKKTLEQIANRM